MLCLVYFFIKILTILSISYIIYSSFVWKMMKISKLIERLDTIQDECGDVEVEYAHNDGGIIMCGSSEITEFKIKDNILILL